MICPVAAYAPILAMMPIIAIKPLKRSVPEFMIKIQINLNHLYGLIKSGIPIGFIHANLNRLI